MVASSACTWAVRSVVWTAEQKALQKVARWGRHLVVRMVASKAVPSESRWAAKKADHWAGGSAGKTVEHWALCLVARKVHW